MSWIKEVADAVPKLLGMTSDLLHLGGVLTKTGEGESAIFALDPKAVRTHFPRMSKTAEHESRWTVITAKLEAAHRQAILRHFMPSLQEEQQADLIQSAADAAVITPDGEEQVLEHLRHIAELPVPQAQIDYADSLNWIKGDPNEYWIVKIQGWAGRRFVNLQQIVIWLNDPGPTGFRAKAMAAEPVIGDAAVEIRAALNNAALTLNNRSQQINDRVNGWRSLWLGRLIR